MKGGVFGCMSAGRSTVKNVSNTLSSICSVICSVKNFTVKGNRTNKKDRGIMKIITPNTQKDIRQRSVPFASMVTILAFALPLLFFGACNSGETEESARPGYGDTMNGDTTNGDITNEATDGTAGEAVIRQTLEGIHVEDPWARPGVEGRMSAAYFLVTNYGEEADTLLRAYSDVARQVEVHESYETDDGMMGMREVSQFPIPAGETVPFRQGGLHVMLIQLVRPLNVGDEIVLTLEFEHAGEITLDVPVRL